MSLSMPLSHAPPLNTRRPILVSTRTERSTEPTRTGGLGKLTFIIVEDDTLQAIDLENVLEEMGHAVAAVAQHSAGASALLDRHGAEIDCAILDLDLAGESSIRFAMELERRGVPYLMITGHAEDVANEHGFDCVVIEKPYTVSQLRNGLLRTLG